MLYAKVADGEVVAYPYSFAQIREDNPSVSFPLSVEPADLEPFGAIAVAEVEPEVPEGKIAEEGEPAFVDGVLSQTWTFVDAPPPPVPAQVTRAQAKLALHAAGLLDGAQSAISGAGTEAEIYWQDASVFERAHPLIASIGAALGLTESEIDDLFRDAATR